MTWLGFDEGALYALSLALLVCTLVLAVLVCLAPRAGLMDHPGERRRLHRESVPRVGGLAVFAGLLASLGVGPSLTAAEGYGLAGAALLVLVGTMAALVPYLVCNLDRGPARSKVFLGDAGSLLLGYLIVWGLIVASQAPGGLAPVTALWLVAIPLMDTLAVMGRRLRQVLRNEAIFPAAWIAVVPVRKRTMLRIAALMPLGPEAARHVSAFYQLTSFSMDYGALRPGVRPGGGQGGVPARGGGGVADPVHPGPDPGHGRSRPGADGGACRVGLAIGD